MHLRRSLGLVTACAVAAGPTALLTAAPAAAADPVRLQILSINDLHGRLEPNRDEVGAARLGGVVDALRDEVPGTSVVSAGDNIGASPFISSSDQDNPTIDALNAIGLDASALGNHELDRGYDDLSGRVVPRAAFPVLGANVEGESPELPGSTVVTVGGLRVGYVGVVTEQTAQLVTPSGIEGITFTDPVAAANREAAALTDGDESNGEADVVVLLAHEGAAEPAATEDECDALYDRDDAFGEIVRGVSADVDAVFGGHTHLLVDCALPVPGAPGTTRPVLEAQSYGTALARLVADVDPDSGDVTVVEAGVMLLADAFPDASDPEVEEIVAAARARSDELGREVVGRIGTDVERAVDSAGEEDRGAESVLGNFIADVQLWAVRQEGRPGADIAFMNPGGLRDDLLVGDQFGDEAPGEVTYGELAAVQPFANTLFTLDLTGEEVRQVLEQQYQPEGSSRPFLALGVSAGLFFRYDDAAPAGERISEISLDGEPLDPDATYRVVTNSFLASGGDAFTALAGGTNRTDTGVDDLSALVDFFRAQSPVSPEPASRRVPGDARTAQEAVGARAVDDSCPSGSVPAAQYPDVEPGSTHALAVRCVRWYEIAQGYEDGRFRPLDGVSRGQMAAFVARSLERAGVELPDAPADAFTDDDGTTHEPRIDQLAALGVVRGRADGTYGPDDVVSRAQMTSYLLRAYETAVGYGLPLGRDYFDDVAGIAQRQDVDRVAAVGITGGTSARTFSPTMPASRAEMASFLARLLDVLVEDGVAAPPAG